MRILMNMNIYITKQNEAKLRRESSMNGLINHLLDKHFKHSPEVAVSAGRNLIVNGSLMENVEVSETAAKKIETEYKKKPVPEALKPRLCKNGHPIPYPRDKCLGKGCQYA